MLRASVAAVLAILATASFAAEPEPASASTSSGITILDKRPAADKKGKILSVGITSCEYGVYRLDEKRAPGRFDALRLAIESAKGAALAGKTLQVSRFDVYFNNGARLRRMTQAAHGDGVLVGALLGMGEKCTPEKMRGGWFSGGEVVTAYGPIIIEMSATLDGATYDARIVHSPSIEMMGGFKSPPEKAEMAHALKTAAEALAAKLP